MSEPYRTQTGRELTDADIEALANEAGRGYDVSHLLRRRVASRVSLLTDISGWYSVVVDDLSYDPTTRLFSFTYDGAPHHIPRERVQVIRELKEKK